MEVDACPDFSAGHEDEHARAYMRARRTNLSANCLFLVEHDRWCGRVRTTREKGMKETDFVSASSTLRRSSSSCTGTQNGGC